MASLSGSVSLQQAPIRGECHALCPINESAERARAQELSRFECPTAVARELVPVKKYRRAAAGRTVNDPFELRPAPVLLRTLDHLFTTVLAWPQSGFDTWHSAQVAEFLAVYYFVTDRVRSVRQDFTIQRIEGTSLITALQQIVRFHLLAGLRAMQLLPSATYKQDWSENLNDQQLVSALSQLQELYQTHSHTNLDVREIEEFTAYALLLHANDPATVACMLQRLSPTRRKLPRVQQALCAIVAMQTDVFYAFFATFATLSKLERAISLRHLPNIWTRSLRMLNQGVAKLDRFPLEQLARWMGLAPLQSQGEGVALAELLCKGLNISTQGADRLHSKDPVPSARFQAAPLQHAIASDTLQHLLRAVALREDNDIRGGLTARILNGTQRHASREEQSVS